MPKPKQATKKRYALLCALSLSLRPKLPADLFLPTQAWYNQKGAHIFGALYLTLVWVSLIHSLRYHRGGNT